VANQRGQQPHSLTIDEGKAMIMAARRYDRAFQTGSQERSYARYRLAREPVRNGPIDKVDKTSRPASRSATTSS
jgi:predicted dehydrogenase